jgi:DNA-binding transcriptional MerR regulator
VPGAAARFGVSRNVIRAWIRRGLVRGTRGDFGTHRDVHWIDIDEVTALRLMARRSRRKQPDNV